MNYAEMSDFEINKAVFLKLNIDYEDFDLNPFPDDCASLSYGDGANWHEFDACNDPLDAWPIIVENDIMLNPNCEDSLWKAEQGFRVKPSGFYGVATAYSKNPLRAAMIVFLMMNEDK